MEFKTDSDVIAIAARSITCSRTGSILLILFSHQLTQLPLP